ncbi:Methyltransferase domain-containing protein [Lentzea waywayandensis]|uniref:Methyltransferase domain-containing protein n=1 Tax=Lentzea waywayandensis TaxID=84724 RepID=A0A1I6DEX2_9PSEU|nr:class I SAM-dependent methyltransferase [Lentzea waywayandensis]SFR03852.1 Methyltransferase domain-containing protein [Lentzea waywayandensis]
MVSPTAFEQAWKLGDQVPGWLTVDQATMLWRAALRLGPGARIVEIGSHQGRSTTVLGLAARSVGATVVAVDPFVEGRLFGGTPTRVSFEKNLARAGLNDVVRLEDEYSTKLRKQWNERVHLLYIDGKHDYWTFTDDMLWSENLVPDGEILVHDAFSSIGVTCGIIAKVLCGNRYVYVDRAGSLARFRLTRPGRADRRRVLAEMPWFVRNVWIKVLLRLRLRPVARLFGHDGPYDPY